jgi:2-C-methyl-D-erythritol 4-phosphate cytidylyltransferase
MTAPGSARHADIGAIIVAAGSGTRFGDGGKVLAQLHGKPLLQFALELFTSGVAVGQVVIVLGTHTLEAGRALVQRLGLEHVTLCMGGATRSESVRAGLDALDAAAAYVAVHDAARPLATPSLVERIIAAARETGAALPAIPVGDTIHIADESRHIASTPDRSTLWAAQTPQVVRREWLLAAFARREATTDEAGLLASAGYPVAIVAGEPLNLKITHPGDLAVAAALQRASEGQS